MTTSSRRPRAEHSTQPNYSARGRHAVDVAAIMTRTVIAVAVLALAARASATKGSKPEKALGKKGCDICSGSTVDAHAEGASLVFDTRVPHCVRARRPRPCDILTVVRLGFNALVY